MYLVCSIPSLVFCELGEEEELDYGESLMEAVDLVVIQYRYNIKQVRENRQSNHDKFSVYDMKAIVSFCGELMKPGSHGHMFRTTLQFVS